MFGYACVCVCACVTKIGSRLEICLFLTVMSSRTEINEGRTSEPELQPADQMEKVLGSSWFRMWRTPFIAGIN